MKRIELRHSSILAALLLCVGACVASHAVAATWQVVMGTDLLFHPSELTIAPGDSVSWVNADVITHTTTSGSQCVPNGIWNSGDVPPGGNWGMVFNQTDVTLEYFCTYHCGLGMVGHITVMLATPTTPTTWGAIKTLYR